MSTLKEKWVEFSIRDISTQCHFALLAWRQLDVSHVPDIDTVFVAVHSFLAHTANASKLLTAKDIESDKRTNTVGGVLGVPDTSIIHSRTLRNDFEHYDERLQTWLTKKGANVNVGDYNIGPKNAISIPGLVYVRHYDPTSKTFTFVDDDHDLSVLVEEVKAVKERADKWVENNA